jgi:hypothetical protein
LSVAGDTRPDLRSASHCLRTGREARAIAPPRSGAVLSFWGAYGDGTAHGGTKNASFKAIYNLKNDMKSNKFDLTEKLVLADIEELPYYLQKNIKKYKDWLD